MSFLLQYNLVKMYLLITYSQKHIFFIRNTFIRNSRLKIPKKLRNFKELRRLGLITKNNFSKEQDNLCKKIAE